MKRILFSFLVLVSFALRAQSDIQSLGVLPSLLKETSGLISYNGKLITHNDSGNEAELYELEPETLQITRTIRVLNVDNLDWEDIAQDSDYIYVGDIGNNKGDRQDLGILRIAKSDFDDSEEVIAERITFFYEDQTDFTPTENSDFDAEALFVFDNQLVVLTKQWQSGGTVAYSVPKVPGAFLAETIGSYQVDGLVTGADYDVVSNSLFLIGYSQFLAPFFIEFLDVEGSTIFGAEQKKTVLNIGPTQMEAITFSNGICYTTSEEFINAPLVDSPAQLFTFSLDETNGEGEELPSPNPDDNSEMTGGLVLYKRFNALALNYELNSDANRPIFGMGIYDSAGRMLTYTPLECITDEAIDISNLSQGLYYLAFFYNNRVISSAFYRD